MNIKPLGDRVIVKVTEIVEQKTKSGIIVPDTAKDKPQEAEVIAVGPGPLNEKGERVAMDLAVGDKIIFSKYGGMEIKILDEPLLILSERDILAKLI